MAFAVFTRGVSRRSAFTPFRSLRFNSTTPNAEPPLLLKIRNDIKQAARAKDKRRLDVLRAMLSDAINKQKESSSGTDSDVKILALIRKRITLSEKAAAQFSEAGRPELKEKEESQIKILEEYANAADILDAAEVRAIIADVIQKLSEGNVNGGKVPKTDVIKALLGPSGAFAGKPVDKAEVVKLTNLALGEAPKA